MRLPTTLRTIAEAFARLPSIGPRQAIRMAVHLASLPPSDQERFATALANIRNVTRCVECGFPHEGPGDRCEICANPQRSPQTLMVVEKETDLLSLEKTGKFSGRYLIIGMMPRGGTLSEYQKQRLTARVAQARTEGLDEVILALSGTVPGEQLASAISAVFTPVAKRVTRLGRGLPRGGEIEFADEDTLGYSLESRH